MSQKEEGGIDVNLLRPLGVIGDLGALAAVANGDTCKNQTRGHSLLPSSQLHIFHQGLP